MDNKCYSYEIFDGPAASYLDFKSSSKQIPRRKSDCYPSAKLYYDRYENLPLGPKTIRHVCYPKQQETLSAETPPTTDEGEPMVYIDKEYFQLVWNEKLEPKLKNQSWLV